MSVRRHASGLIIQAILGMVLVLLCAACGDDTKPLEIRVVNNDPVESIEPERLVAKVYTVVERSDVLATATQPDGQQVSAVSCRAITTFAPTATECIETDQVVERDEVLVHTGPIARDGTLVIDRPTTNLRIYVDLPSNELRVDERGRFCRWTGRTMVDSDVDTIEVPLTAIC